MEQEQAWELRFAAGGVRTAERVSIDPGAFVGGFKIRCQLFLIFDGVWRALIVFGHGIS